MADNAYFVISTPHRAFSVSFNTLLYVTDILKISMWKFNLDKKYFFDKFTAFLT